MDIVTRKGHFLNHNRFWNVSCNIKKQMQIINGQKCENTTILFDLCIYIKPCARKLKSIHFWAQMEQLKYSPLSDLGKERFYSKGLWW